MAQHDYAISDQNGLSFLADLNSALAAVASSNSGGTQPANPQPFMPWADTAGDLLKIRNAANSAWIPLMVLSTGVPAAASPSTSGTLTHSGDVVLSGSGRRITGDFSNATVANRVLFQTSTVDTLSQIGVIPNGAGVGSYFTLSSTSDPANCSIAQLDSTTTSMNLVANKEGFGTYLPMTFYTGGAARMQISVSGKVSVGAVSDALDKDIAQFCSSGYSNTMRFYQAGIGEMWFGMKASSGWFSFGSGSGTVNECLRFNGNGNLEVISPNGSIGYGAGAGGTVTQATSKATTVTLNKPCGLITMHNAALAAGASVYFMLNNTLLALADVVGVTLNSYGSNYRVETANIANGSVVFRVTNVTVGPLSESLVINFAIIKGANS